MNVYVSKQSGFCFGVRRAVNIAQTALRQFSSQKLYTIGPLIHNPQVVAALAKKGLRVAHTLQEVKNGILVVRSHGASPSLLQKACRKGLRIIDATCPFVKRSQAYCRTLCQDGYTVIVVGKTSHPEIAAMREIGKSIYSLLDVKEIECITDLSKVGLIAQTTLSKQHFHKVKEYLLNKNCFELRIINTICDDTTKRQHAACALAAQCDMMIIIGGRESANTSTLANLCARICRSTYHIETPEELQGVWLRGKMRIGISTGASTPDYMISRTIKKLDKLKKVAIISKL